MSRVPPLHLTHKEALILSLLVGVGGSSFDLPAGIGNKIRERMEKQFDIEISGDDVANIINKVKSLTEKSGSEEVVVGD